MLRKFSPTAPEQCYGIAGAVLQHSRKVSPRLLEKVYGSLRKIRFAANRLINKMLDGVGERKARKNGCEAVRLLAANLTAFAGWRKSAVCLIADANRAEMRTKTAQETSVENIYECPRAACRAFPGVFRF